MVTKFLTSNRLVAGLLALVVLLGLLAAWDRFAKPGSPEVSDVIDGRTEVALDGYVLQGGIATGLAGTPRFLHVCPRCRTSAWTPGNVGNVICPSCRVPMRWQSAQITQVGGTWPGACVTPVAGVGTGVLSAPLVIHAGAGRPHPDRGSCTNCHTVIASNATNPVLWRGAAAPTIPADAVAPTLIKEVGMEVVDAPGGVRVTGVMGNSWAERGGLRAGDVILEVNATRIRDLAQLEAAVAKAPPEMDAQLKILRLGHTKDLAVTVGEGEMEGFTPIKKP